MSTYTEDFTEERVTEWSSCTGVDLFGEETFGQTVVPNMMLFSPLSRIVQEFHDEDVMITDITAFRFRDPVLVGESAEYTLRLVDEREHYDSIQVEVGSCERDSLCAVGTISVTEK